MIPPIYFNVEQARNQLLNEGKVYTIRYARKTGETIARHGSYYKFKILGKVRITEVMWLELDSEYKLQGTKVDLQKYVDQSGFKTVDDWLAEIKKQENIFLVDSPVILYLVEALK